MCPLLKQIRHVTKGRRTAEECVPAMARKFSEASALVYVNCALVYVHCALVYANCAGNADSKHGEHNKISQKKNEKNLGKKKEKG